MWRISWFRKNKLPKREWVFPQVESFDLPPDLIVYLIGFSYDAPTTKMAGWLKEILASRKVQQSKIVRFGDKCNKDQLAKALAEKTPRIELFCGHGNGSGLYGPPQQEVAGSVLSDLTSIIYDVEMITETPSSMFAFCCQAAQVFGRIFSSYKDKQFMGFRDDIPFPLELYDDLKYVFQTVAKDIIQHGRIERRHRQMFLEKLDEIARQPVDFQNAVLIDLWLAEYRKHLMVYA